MKIIVRRSLMLLYLAAVVISILILVKPGASFFYIKRTLDRQSIVRDAGFAYRYKLPVNPAIIRTSGILLYEDGKPLYRAEANAVVTYGSSSFVVTAPSQGAVFLYFAPSDNSNPITNGRSYTLYMPLRFFSQRLGIIYLLIFSVPAVWFLIFAISDPQRRKVMTHSPAGILQVSDSFIEQIGHSIRRFNNRLWSQVKFEAFFWKRLFTITVLAVYLYTFMEWLFFVTMPSFMSILSLPAKVEIFLLAGLFSSAMGLGVVAIYIGLSLMGVVLHISRFIRYLGVLIPTIILSALALILFDNFTYTIFKFGIVTTAGIWRVAYGVFFTILSGYIYFRLTKTLGLRGKDKPSEQPVKVLSFVSLCILAVSIGLAFVRMDYSRIFAPDPTVENQQAARHPNILLIGSDGVNADNLSVYGYARDTTPRLRELGSTSLVAENAFTNSANTAGSIISIMTSKLPTQTRLLYPPDILSGINAYQHLPGILKRAGYQTIEFGVPYYVDAYSFNVQDGFDMVNNRSNGEGQLADIGQRVGFENALFFIDKMGGRITDRILHIYYLREMQNPYKIVSQPVPSINDTDKISQIVSLFDEATEPLFIHVHLLGTHGGYFSPAIKSFSRGEAQIGPWMVDFYDDTILSFDQYVGEVVNHLKADGQYDNTILIIYTDHNQNFSVNKRIPLIFHFPGGEYAGRVTKTAENLDIAPTILDYLGLSKPDWMGGESLLNSEVSEHRLIFSMGTSKAKNNEQKIFVLDPNQVKPPFYQFSFVNIIDCQKWYTFDLTHYVWETGTVPGYVNPCNSDDLISFDAIKQAMIKRLSMDGFDTSSIP